MREGLLGGVKLTRLYWSAQRGAFHTAITGLVEDQDATRVRWLLSVVWITGKPAILSHPEL